MDVCDLENPGLDRLDLVAQTGCGDDDRRMRERDDLDLVLPHAHGLDEDHLVAHGVQHQHRVVAGARQAAELSAGTHRADEHTLIGGMALHPHAVPENRTPGEGAGGVDRDHADAPAALALFRDQHVDQRRFADSAGAGDTHEMRATGMRSSCAQVAPSRPGARTALTRCS